VGINPGTVGHDPNERDGPRKQGEKPRGSIEAEKLGRRGGGKVPRSRNPTRRFGFDMLEEDGTWEGRKWIRPEALEKILTFRGTPEETTEESTWKVGGQ